MPSGSGAPRGYLDDSRAETNRGLALVRCRRAAGAPRGYLDGCRQRRSIAASPLRPARKKTELLKKGTISGQLSLIIYTPRGRLTDLGAEIEVPLNQEMREGAMLEMSRSRMLLQR